MKLTNRTRLENDKPERFCNEMFNLQVKLDDIKNDDKNSKPLNSIKTLCEAKNFRYEILLKYVTKSDYLIRVILRRISK